MSRVIAGYAQPTSDRDGWGFAENGVRQLLAAGKDKSALDRAKDLHKMHGTPASEALLVDAYVARIRSLSQQNLAVEAKALIALVRERYPSAGARLGEVAISASVRSGSVDELLAPLNYPDLPPERRATIERAVEQDVLDIGAIAECNTLPPEHPLRQSANALRAAFAAATTGPVAADLLAVPVSHRSPLAPWKLLIRAIAAFHAGDDEICRRTLDAIKPESAPGRLVPVLRNMLRPESGAAVSGPAAELVQRMSGGSAKLRESLETLDEALQSGNNGRILEAIRAAMRDCRMVAPSLCVRLQQQIAVRCSILDAGQSLRAAQVDAAMGSPAKRDAHFLRMLALGLESTHDAANALLACAVWDEFRTTAAEEGWFAPKGLEVATLYLHMASLIASVPAELIEKARPTLAVAARGQQKVWLDTYFLDPEKLYQRACTLDPSTAAFAQWLSWARQSDTSRAEDVAKAWHKILPRDLEPLVFLMQSSERSGAFHTALEYLKKAERIDSLHTDIRNARYRFMIGSALKRIAGKKTDLASETMREVAALPQAQRGDRAVVPIALEALIRAAAGDSGGYEAKRREVESFLANRAAASILLSGLAESARRHNSIAPLAVSKLTRAERSSLPASLARVALLLDELELSLGVPTGYLKQTYKEFPKAKRTLEVEQLHGLGELALSNCEWNLAYAISDEGLGRGDGSAASFLLMRAESLLEHSELRTAVCAATAAQLGRQVRDMEIVDKAVEYLRDELGTDGPPITPEEAQEVLRSERAASKFPKHRKDGPDYSRFRPDEPCQCPDCRRARGETTDDFDDDDDWEDELDMGDLPPLPIPPGMPPAIAKMLIAQLLESRARGESFNDFLDRVTVNLVPPGGRSKGKKKGRPR